MNWRVSAQYRPFSWFNLSPSLNQSWSDQNLRESATRSRRSDRFSTRAALSQTFYGLFNPSIGPLQALRHVLKPSISFNYQASRADTGGVFGFGGDGSRLQHRRTLNLRLDNTFWAKILRDEEEHKVRLVQFNFYTAYDFEKKERQLDDLRTTLNVEAGRYLNSRLTLRHEFYDEQNQRHLLAPRRKQLEVRTSASWSRRSAASREETGRTSSFDSSSRYGSSGFDTYSSYGSSSSGTANPYGSSSLGTASRYGRESFGFENGLMRDIDSRRRGSRFQLSHYISHRRATTTTPSFIRSWIRAAAGFSLASWHCNYSLNYNLRAPGTRLLSTERFTSELLSLQKEFHDWTATLNVQPSTFHKNRAFFFKIQLKDIPQLKLERGQRRF